MRVTTNLFETPAGNAAMNDLIRQESRRHEIWSQVPDPEPATPPTTPDGTPLPGGSGDGGYRGDVGPVDPNARANELIRGLVLSRQ